MLWVFACGGDNNQIEKNRPGVWRKFSREIGSSGGVLRDDESGFYLRLPAGALKETTQISVTYQAADNFHGVAARMAIGSAESTPETLPVGQKAPLFPGFFGGFRLEPDIGLEADAEICYHISPAALAGLEIRPEEATLIRYGSDTREWTAIGGYDLSKNGLCGTTRHFSEIAVAVAENPEIYQKTGKYCDDIYQYNEIDDSANIHMRTHFYLQDSVGDIANEVFDPKQALACQNDREIAADRALEFAHDVWVRKNTHSTLTYAGTVAIARPANANTPLIYLPQNIASAETVFAENEEWSRFRITGQYDAGTVFAQTGNPDKLYIGTIIMAGSPDGTPVALGSNSLILRQTPPVDATGAGSQKPGMMARGEMAPGTDAGAFVVFNYPVGNTLQYRIPERPAFVQRGNIFRHIAYMINNAGADAQIHLTNYHFGPGDMGGELGNLFYAIARKKEQIYLLAGENEDGVHNRDVKGLGDYMRTLICADEDNAETEFPETCVNPKSRWVILDSNGSDEADSIPIMHTKVILVSKTKSPGGKPVPWMACLTSTNYNQAELEQKINDMVCVYGDQAYYEKIRNLFWDCSGETCIIKSRKKYASILEMSLLKGNNLKWKLNIPSANSLNSLSYGWSPLNAQTFSIKPFGKRINGIKNYGNWFNDKVSEIATKNYAEFIFLQQAQNDESFYDDYIETTKNREAVRYYYLKRNEETEDAFQRWRWIGVPCLKYDYKWDWEWEWPPVQPKFYCEKKALQPGSNKRMVRFHTKTAYLRGKNKSMVLMGSRNAKTYDATDATLKVVADPGESNSIVDYYRRYFAYTKKVKF